MILLTFCFLACDQREPGSAHQTQTKVDSLSPEEHSFLKQLLNENESLIVSSQVERVFSGNNSIPLVNKLVFSKELLGDKGYVYLEIQFLGKISDISLTYKYSRGTADTGYGSVSGRGLSDYIHSRKSCGVTTCITQVFNNGKKIFEKED